MFQRLVEFLSRNRVQIAVGIFILFQLLIVAAVFSGEYGEETIGWDSLIYKEAAQDLAEEQPLYDEPEKENPYYYTPLYAALYNPLGELDDEISILVWWAVLTAALLVQLWVWRKVVQVVLPEQSAQFWAWLLPFMLVSSDMMANLAYGNVIILLGLPLALAAWGVIRRNPVWMGAAIAVIAISKVQLLAFPALLLIFVLLDRDWTFLGGSLIIAVVIVAVFFGIAVLLTSADYVWEQLGEQVEFLAEAADKYPFGEWFAWNSSIHQQVYRFPFLEPVAPLLILLVILWWVGHWASMVWRAVTAGARLPADWDTVLLLAFGAYIVGMFSNHVVNDLLYGVVVWAYVRSFGDERVNGRWPTVILFCATVWIAVIWIGLPFYYLTDIVPLNLVAGVVLYWMIARLVNKQLRSRPAAQG